MDLKKFIEINYNAKKVSKYAIGYIDRFYNNLFSNLKEEKFEILEIGIHNGDSIRIWNDFFKNAIITCIDIKENILAEDLKYKKNVRCIYADAYNKKIFETLKNKKFDIIIDDGPHTLESLIFFSENYFKFLKPKGYFILEDIINPEWSSLLCEKLPKDVEYKEIINMQGLQKTKKLYERWKNGLDVIICKNI